MAGAKKNKRFQASNTDSISAKKVALSLEWTFGQRITIPSDVGPASFIVLGSGPYIFSFFEEHGEAQNHYFALTNQLCVFEQTGTYVQGITNISNDYVAIWGGSYMACIPTADLLKGGAVCQQNIFSTGRSIAWITFTCATHNPCGSLIDVYFADGVVQEVVFVWRKKMEMAPAKTFRFPLNRGEMITAVFQKSETTIIGTSHGRLMSERDRSLGFVTKSLINNPIKQIEITASGQINSNTSFLLVFANGSIGSFKEKSNKRKFIKIEGRFTQISSFTFGLGGAVNTSTNFEYNLVGDRDGNVTAIRVDSRKLEVFRTTKNLTQSPITMIEVVGRGNLLIGSSSGELIWFDLTSMCRIPCNVVIPYQVTASDCYYKTYNGWWFLYKGKLCMALNAFDGTSMVPKTKEETKFDQKNVKMKFFSRGGYSDREIAFVYNQTGRKNQEFYCKISDYTNVTITGIHFRINLNDHTHTPSAIVQVILMHAYVLIQTDAGRALLFYYEEQNETFPMLFETKTKSRITAATCIVHYDPGNEKVGVNRPTDVMLNFLDGTGEVIPIQWSSVNSGKLNQKFHQICYNFDADLQGSYVVSALSSWQQIGNLQCILLSRKGIAYLVGKNRWPGHREDTYKAVLQQDLSPIIGRGHSLQETSKGILATGFKRHTLNVCWISLGIYKPNYFCHLFSVDTRSCRLPFTLLEDKLSSTNAKTGRKTSHQLIVSYYNNEGSKEERFPYYSPDILHGIRHSGIITHGFIRDEMEDKKKYFYTGDTDGNLCIWAMDEKSMAGRIHVGDFKLDGAVTGIQSIGNYIAVSTSKGNLHLYFKFKIPCIQLIPKIPYDMGQKINNIKSVELENESFLLVFLEDGSVKQIKFDLVNEHASSVEKFIKQKKVAKLSIPTKIALCKNFKNCYYITALGMDGILRRTKLLPPENVTIETKWKLSTINEIVKGPVNLITAGDPQGWVYLLVYLGAPAFGPCFYIDRIHKHQIIDVYYYPESEEEVFLISLDITGTVVIRNLHQGFWAKDRAIIWACPVPSPRKVTVAENRKVMVLGKGMATRTF